MALEPIGDIATVNLSKATIPSSAIHRWKLDDVASGTVTDSIGSADGTVNGVSSVSGDYQGGSAGDGDGTDDYINVGQLGNFGSNLLDGTFSVALTIDNYDESSGNPTVFGESNSGNSQFLDITPRADLSGQLQFTVRDPDGDIIEVEASTDLSDGDKYRVVVTKGGNDANDLSVYVNDSDDNASPDRNDSGFGSTTDFDENVRLFARGGLNDAFIDATLDDIIVYDSELSTGEVSDDYNAQPWT